MDYDYEAGVVPFVLEADHTIKSLIFEMAPIYRSEFGEMQDVTVPLFTELHSTSESILILLQNRGVYDADVLLRTVMEGTVKYCYLMTGDYDVRKEKYEEYKVDLTNIDKLVDHQKAVQAVEILKEFSDHNTKPFEASILKEAEREILESQYPRDKRNRMKGKWSYGTLLRDLAQKYKEYEAQLGSLSSYALTSHFCHFDWTGVSMRNEQVMIASKDDGALEFAHALRILSNVLTCYLLRVVEYMRGNSYSSPQLATLSMSAYDLTSRINALQNKIVENEMK